MITKRFGRTDLQIPVLSMGGMRFQQSWRDSGQEIEVGAQRRLEETVRRGIDLGINHIETARGYGTSERQLGLLLPQLDREKLIVQTKIAPSPDSAEFADHVEESLRRLQLERVDLLAIHGINTFEKLWWAVRPGGCLEIARRMQQAGQVGHVGFSTHGSLELIQTALRHEQNGGFDYVNLHWYYIWQYNWPAILTAAERDIGVFIISPSDKGGRLYDPPQKLVELCEPLHPLAFNTLFCLSRPEVHTLSLGAASPADFDLAVGALDFFESSIQLLPEIEQRLAVSMKEVVGPAGVPGLLKGIPDWESAPGYVNVRVIIWLRALVLAYGMTDYARERYNMLGNAADWFPGANAAAVDHIEFGKAVRHSPHRDHIVDWLTEVHHLLADEPQVRLSESE